LTFGFTNWFFKLPMSTTSPVEVFESVESAFPGVKDSVSAMEFRAEAATALEEAGAASKDLSR
jgi:hypothetical protein